MMTKILPMIAAALIYSTSPALADPIVITGGSVSFGGFLGPFPPFGVELLGSNTVLRGVTFNEGSPFITLGRTIDLSKSVNVSTSLSFGPLEQTVNGARFTDVVLRGTLDFRAVPFFAPGNAVGGFRTPFTMNGIVSLFVDPQHPDERVLTAQLTGSGIASIGLGRDFGNGSFSTSAMTFAFDQPAATPEPATLLLVSGGGLIALRRSRRRSWR